ncbi:T9SS type A sorting domain-containing protein [Polaribacter sp.]|uniref:T9SS type A sorting domain-containing protein n=1 Tax=Polaribacter sp. TaxID=1920175 RepID=UPI003F6AC230
MWFRNHAITQIGSTSRFVEDMTIIGNEIESENGERTGIRDGEVGMPGKNTFSGGNILNVSVEGEDGNVVWGDMKPEDQIPASLFLSEKPDYLNKWPLYGTPASSQLGIDGILEKKKLLFPNPTNGLVHLPEVIEWEVFSIKGALLNSGESKKIDLRKYKSGVYLILIKGKLHKLLKH